MSVTSFKELKNHVGHKIEVVVYGKEGLLNVSCECVTCNTVLMDFDNEEV